MRRRWRLALAALAASGVAGIGAGPATSGEPAPVELARGGMSVLPEYRPIGFYGAPQSPELGELGIGSPGSAYRRLKRQIRPYKSLTKKPIYPLFELLGTIALANPGPDGLYRARQPDRIIRRYAQVARRKELLLMLDIQPGRAKFIDEVRHLKPWLRKPFVSVALDPEWNMGRRGVPGERIGHVGAWMVNRVTAYLDELAARRGLPDKLVVIHQFTDDMVRDKDRLKVRDHVDLVLNADGFGSPEAKRSKYEELAPSKSSGIRAGFKLFYKEDTNLMSPKQVVRLNPRPSVVVYE